MRALDFCSWPAETDGCGSLWAHLYGRDEAYLPSEPLNRGEAQKMVSTSVATLKELVD